jgi:hypothetical protein
MVTMGSGIPALVFLCWFLVRAVHSLRRTAAEGGFLDYAWGISTSMLVVGYAVRNFFDDLFFAGSSFSLFLMLLAIALSGRADRAATVVHSPAIALSDTRQAVRGTTAVS